MGATKEEVNNFPNGFPMHAAQLVKSWVSQNAVNNLAAMIAGGYGKQSCVEIVPG